MVTYLGLGFQSSVTPIMEGVVDLHNHIFFFLILVFVFVFWVFGNILYHFWWKIQHPSTAGDVLERVSLASLRHLSHSTVLEVVWTIIPSLILVAIAVPSFALLYAMDEIMEPAVTLKVIGHQWYWSYQYSDCVSDGAYVLGENPDMVPAMLWEDLWAAGARYKVVNPAKAGKQGAWTFFGYAQPPFVLEKPYHLVGGEPIVLPPKETLALISKPSMSENPVSFCDLNGFAHLYFRTFWGTSISNFLHETVFYTDGFSSLPVAFDSYMLNEPELPRGGYRLLEVDEPIVLPVNTHVRLLITADDVIHSFAVPQLGVKVDATPGRLNQQGVFIKRRGVFYGQCSELCGVNHGFMPIVVKAVSSSEFLKWYLVKLDSLYPGSTSFAPATEVRSFLEDGVIPARFQSIYGKEFAFIEPIPSHIEGYLRFIHQFQPASAQRCIESPGFSQELLQQQTEKQTK